MATISLCMIVKNEEEVLDNCLSSVKEACDEMIIVDTGSMDKTKEIAKQYTNKIYDFTWIDDFSAARNFAFSHATKDFIMWLDADDILQEEDLEKLLELKKKLTSSVDVVSMKYHLAFDDIGNPTFSFKRNRLVKRSNQFKWRGFVHEYLEVSGHILHSDIAVTHNKHLKETGFDKSRNLRIYEKQLKNGIRFTPRDLYYYANELRENKEYKRAISYYNQFLATKKGWIEDSIRACLYLEDCYRHIGKETEAFNALVSSFKYDEPRPEVSYRLGEYLMENKAYQTAVFWFNLATKSTLKNHGGFVEPAYTTFYPNLQLCVCYWQLGQMDKSYEHHKMAANFRPNDPIVIKNEQFFAQYYSS